MSKWECGRGPRAAATEAAAAVLARGETSEAGAMETLSRDRGFQRKPASPGFWFHVTRAASVRSAAVRSCPESGRLAVASASGGQKPPRISTKQAPGGPTAREPLLSGST
jgi:hypothetical protein